MNHCPTSHKDKKVYLDKVLKDGLNCHVNVELLLSSSVLCSSSAISFSSSTNPGGSILNFVVILDSSKRHNMTFRGWLWRTENEVIYNSVTVLVLNVTGCHIRREFLWPNVPRSSLSKSKFWWTPSSLQKIMKFSMLSLEKKLRRAAFWKQWPFNSGTRWKKEQKSGIVFGGSFSHG